jgi:hypothetical protein
VSNRYRDDAGPPPPQYPPPRPGAGYGRNGPYVVHVRRDHYDVYVGRPSKWGNPFVVGRDGSRADVIAKYRAYLLDRPALVDACRRELRGKVLGCWCAPRPCHADVLAAIANPSALPLFPEETP